jgi:hypothetical protein
MTPEAMKAEIERLATERNALDVQVAALEEQLAEERARFKGGWEAGREAAAEACDLMAEETPPHSETRRITASNCAHAIRALPLPESAPSPERPILAAIARGLSEKAQMERARHEEGHAVGVVGGAARVLPEGALTKAAPLTQPAVPEKEHACSGLVSQSESSSEPLASMASSGSPLTPNSIAMCKPAAPAPVETRLTGLTEKEK